MTSLKLYFNHPDYSDQEISSSIGDILHSNILCSIATSRSGESYIHTAYYCFNNQMEFYFISDPATQHSKNINENPSVAIAVYDSRQPWDNNKRGLQIFGRCRAATGKKLVEGTMLYLQRFTGLKQWIQHPDDFIRGAINSQLYVITSHSVKLFDEDNFGEENYIELRIG